MNSTAKAALAEAIGTFTLTFIGAGAGAAAVAAQAPGLVVAALAHGVALMIIVYTWGAISGAHVNPAVTLGVLVGGKIDLGRAIVYWIAQFVGAIGAAYLLLYLIGNALEAGQTVGSWTTTDSVRTIILEAVLTFFLVAAVYSAAVFNRGGAAVGLAIGLVLTADILCGGPYTGASMNPARTFGPALALGNLSYFWMYLVGPAIGGIVAGLLQAFVFNSNPTNER